MSRRLFYRRFLIVLVAVALFVMGKFYRELDAFFLEPYSLIGLMFVLFAFLITAIIYLKVELMRKKDRLRSCCDSKDLQEEMIYSLKREIKLLSTKKVVRKK